MKSGIGSASEYIGRGVVVAAIAAVNALGDVIEPQANQIIAGARSIHKGPLHIGQPGYFADTLQVLRTLVGRTTMRFAAPKGNTVIGVVATNARLNKEQVTKVSQMAHDGIARTIRPAHTMFDGDTIFTLATGERRADVNIVGAFGAEVFARAILRAVRAAQPVANLPAAAEPPQ
jgi:L-aminopeptidase/D-esterase-like protein